MAKPGASSHLQDVIEQAEKLAPDDRAILMEVLQKRAAAACREQLARDIAAARTAFRRGKVSRGTPKDLARELSA